MNNHWFFIINPVSGSGNGLKLWERVKVLLDETAIDYSFGKSEYHRHTIELVKAKHQYGVRNFIGIGGDGTLNEIVNAIMISQNGKDTSKSIISQLSVGTGNDWVRNQEEQLSEFNLISKLKANKTILHDVGIVESSKPILKQYFINVAGTGLDGRVVHELEKLSVSGKKSKLAYVQSMLKSLTRFDAPESQVKVGNNQVYDGKILVVTASKGQYFGGGMHLSPNAQPNSGTLDITLVKKDSNIVVFPQLYKLFNGKIAGATFVEKFTNTMVELTTSFSIPIQADGEFVGESKHIQFSIVKHAIKVLV